jgi:hypothetical protein
LSYKIINVTLEDDFKVCPTCGYEDGFHTMLKKEEDATRWLFICPSCHNVFDIGHTLPKDQLREESKE